MSMTPDSEIRGAERHGGCLKRPDPLGTLCWGLLNWPRAQGVTVSHGAVEMLMRRAGIKGQPTVAAEPRDAGCLQPCAPRLRLAGN